MESNEHSNTCPKLHLACSCTCLHCPVLSCTEKEGKEREEREEGGGKEEKKIRPPGPPREGLLEEFEIKDQGTGVVRP